MLKQFNSEARHVSGKIKVHTQDFNYKGHTHHATRNMRLKATRPIMLRCIEEKALQKIR